MIGVRDMEKMAVIRAEHRCTFKLMSKTSVDDSIVSFNNPSMNLLTAACLHSAKDDRPSILTTFSCNHNSFSCPPNLVPSTIFLILPELSPKYRMVYQTVTYNRVRFDDKTICFRPIFIPYKYCMHYLHTNRPCIAIFVIAVLC